MKNHNLSHTEFVSKIIVALRLVDCTLHSYIYVSLGGYVALALCRGNEHRKLVSCFSVIR